MGSVALREWHGARAKRVDDLLSLHAVVGGTHKGRRRNLEELNHALILKLAAEFQGFARDLHQVASERFAHEASHGNSAVETMTLKLLTLNRKLDAGNATPSSIGNDFGRLFLNYWQNLRAGSPLGPSASQSGFQNHVVVKAINRLEALNLLRNAIVHSNPSIELQFGVGLLEGAWRTGSTPVASARSSVRKTEVVAIRASLDLLALRMDRLTSRELAETFRIQAPW
jgi:hypothetical protein